MEEKVKRTVIYDVSSVPKGLNVSDVIKKYEVTGIALYDSKKGDAPVFSDLGSLKEDTSSLGDDLLLDSIPELKGITRSSVRKVRVQKEDGKVKNVNIELHLEEVEKDK